MDNSEIIIIRKPVLDEEQNILRSQIKLRRKIRSFDSVVEKIAFLHTATNDYIVILCGKTVTLHRPYDLEVVMTVPLNNAVNFCVSDTSSFTGLAVSDMTTLYLYNLEYGFDIFKPFYLPEQPLCMSWLKDYICVGFREEYSLVNELSGAVIELSSTGGVTPICKALPTEEVLFISKKGAVVAEPLKRKASSFKLSFATKALAFSFPYIFSLSSKSNESVVEIANIVDPTYHEVLRAPNTGKKNTSILTICDDQLHVFALESQSIYSIIPNYNQNMKIVPSTLERTRSPIKNSRNRSDSLGSTRGSTSNSSDEDNKLSHPQDGVVSPRTNNNNNGTDNNNGDENNLRNAQNTSPMLTHVQTHLHSSTASPFNSSATPFSASQNYFIPPPITNDKAAFIKYVRSCLKQEFNPYRLLLIEYSNQISAEYQNSPNAKIDKVKKSVSTYLRRFLRTISPEFKKFSSKTFKELLMVTISIVFHSHLHPLLMGLILAQSEEQDKKYNQMIALLETKKFEPHHFEVRKKFWLTQESVEEEMEKRDAEKQKVSKQQNNQTSQDDQNNNEDGENNDENDENDEKDENVSILTENDVNNDSEPMIPVDHRKFKKQSLTSNKTIQESSSNQESQQKETIRSGEPRPPSNSLAIPIKPGSKRLPYQNDQISPMSDSASSGLPSTYESTQDSNRQQNSFSQALKSSDPTNQDKHQQNHRDLAFVPDLNNASPSLLPESPLRDHYFLAEASLFEFNPSMSYAIAKPQTSSTSSLTLEDNNGTQTATKTSDTADSTSQNPQEEAGGYGTDKTFSLVDTVQVHVDAEHHLFFNFSKSGIEKELSTSDWNFTFKDEQKSIIWMDSKGIVWKLRFHESKKYLEFTTRYRLYEQQLSLSSNNQSTSDSISSSQLGASTISLSGLSQSVSSLEMSSLLSSSITGFEQPSGLRTQPFDHKRASLDLRRLALEQSGLNISTPSPLFSAIQSPASSAIQSPNGSPRSKNSTKTIISTPTHSRSYSTSSSPNPSNSIGYGSNCPYYNAVRALRHVPKQKTPREKIETMAKALSFVATAVDEFWAPYGKKMIVGADDLVPIFSYVVALAKIPNIYSELNYTTEFSNESSLRGKYGYSLATLQICVEHVIQVSTQFMSSNEPAFTQSVDEATTVANDAKRVQDLMGKMETMKKFAVEQRKDEEVTMDISNNSVTPVRSNSPTVPPIESRPSSPSTDKSNATASQTQTEASPKKQTDNDQNSSETNDTANEDDELETQGKYFCTSLEISVPQVEGRMWITKATIHFESGPNAPNHLQRKIEISVNTIRAIKKSWGLFGGDGIDIYVGTDRVLFFRHFKNRDKAYQEIMSEIDLAGVKLQV